MDKPKQPPSEAPLAPAIERVGYEPPGIVFYDCASNRVMKYVDAQAPHWTAGWILVRHPDQSWITLRKATPADLQAIGIQQQPPAAPQSEHERVACVSCGLVSTFDANIVRNRGPMLLNCPYCGVTIGISTSDRSASPVIKQLPQ